MDYSKLNAPAVMKNFLSYTETIQGKSASTVDEYALDLRTFFRYLKFSRNLVLENCQFENIDISDIDINFIKKVSLSETYDFMTYLSRDRNNSARTRARKLSCLKSFFKYLTKSGLITENPMKDFETPKMAQTLPHYLNYEEAVKLLESISGDYKERDYAIITLFLNCGLRVSELVKLNLTDIHADGSIRILGKGNKERIVYLTPACVDALSVYIPLRSEHPKDPNALFLSRLRKRISIKTVQWLVKKFIERAGLDEQSLSVHKLRHTAATLMYQNGADLRVLQEILGHANLGTTQIYTHVANTQLREAALLNPLANKK